MQLMCHLRAYTDQALVVGRGCGTHHYGSTYEKSCVILVQNASAGLICQCSAASVIQLSA